MVAPFHLKALQALELAVRHGSLTKAADALAITPAAVGQRIKALEEYLGMDLLARGRSGLRPTPELAAALPHLSAAFRELETCAATLDMQRGHEIHIAAVSDYAELWLAPRLPAFRAAHPNILFAINGEGDAPARIARADVEIDFAAPRDDADLLFRDLLAPISSPVNDARVGVLPRREQLEGFPLLHLDFYRNDPAALGWPDWIAAHKFKRTAPTRGIRFQRIAPAIEAVLSDAGPVICGLALLRDHIDDGRLTLPFGVAPPHWTAHVFQARYRNENRPQMRRFRAWLTEEAAKTAAWLNAQAGATTKRKSRV